MQFRSMASSFQYRLRQDLKPASVADWREAARRALPEMIWAYVDDGAEGCRTKTRNEAAFDDYRFRQLCLTGVVGAQARQARSPAPICRCRSRWHPRA